uniref:FAR1 domain-containing protein n=1 Tax=Rhizophora mucronata TaxID=61149 RepID=A0A2P2ILV7_RHIMU
MESTSNQAFDSDESERFLQVGNYNEHEFADDELSRSVDLCLVEDGKILVEQSSECLPFTGDDAVMEPYIGMEFKSRDDAREFYIAYGRRTGFTVRIHHNRRSRINNLVIGQDFVCSKEGFREKKYVYRKDRVLPPPPITREGCPAMLRMALRDGVKWVVTKFVKEHNHALMSPGKVPWRGSAKSLVSEDEKDQRIQELTIELNNERQRCKRRCAAYKEQLRMVLAYVEEHTSHLSNKVQAIVNNVKELESERRVDSDCKSV